MTKLPVCQQWHDGHGTGSVWVEGTDGETIPDICPQCDGA